MVVDVLKSSKRDTGGVLLDGGSGWLTALPLGALVSSRSPLGTLVDSRSIGGWLTAETISPKSPSQVQSLKSGSLPIYILNNSQDTFPPNLLRPTAYWRLGPMSDLQTITKCRKYRILQAQQSLLPGGRIF